MCAAYVCVYESMSWVTEIYSIEGEKEKIAAGVYFFHFFHTGVAGSRSPKAFIVHTDKSTGVIAV